MSYALFLVFYLAGQDRAAEFTVDWTPQDCREQLILARQWRTYVYGTLAYDPSGPSVLLMLAVAADAEKRVAAWEYANARKLGPLFDLIGPAEYYAMRMPPPVPLWFFREYKCTY